MFSSSTSQVLDPENLLANATGPKPTPASLIEIEKPIFALDARDTVHHENAISVTRTSNGYRVLLATLDPREAPCFSCFADRKIGSRYEWESLRQDLYVDRSNPQISGLSFGDEPRKAFLVQAELAEDGVSLRDLKISAGQSITVKKALFSEMMSVMSKERASLSDSEIDLKAVAELGVRIFTYRRERGDVLFADPGKGLILQPDGSWEKHPSNEILGRVVVQEITSKVLSELALWCSAQEIPLLYRGCNAASPEIRQKLEQLLKEKASFSRTDVDQFLIDERGRRHRLLHRATCDVKPMPHAGVQSKSYLRTTAPLRVFQDFVNVSQLSCWADGVTPIYDLPDLTKFAAEINQRSDKKVKKKGAQKYRGLIPYELEMFQGHREVDALSLRTIVADCRDAGEMPAVLVNYLFERLGKNPEVIAPILGDIIFSREGEKIRFIQNKARDLLYDRPDLADILIDTSLGNNSIKGEHLSSKVIDDKLVLEVFWRVGGKAIYTQEFLNKAAERDLEREIIRIKRIQLAKVLGLYGKQTQWDTSLPTDLPSLKALSIRSDELNQGFKWFFADTEVFGDGAWEVSLTLKAGRDNWLSNDINEPGRGTSWLEACEDAAKLLLKKLDS